MPDDTNKQGTATHPDNSALSRRNLLLGTSTLVAAATLTSRAMAQAQKTAPATTTPATPKVSNRIKINVRPCSDRSLSSQNWNECQTKQGNKGYKNDEHHRITSQHS